jgi:hypothetical protein
VRGIDATAIEFISTTSSTPNRSFRVMIPAGGRLFVQSNSIGVLSSTQSAPCSAAAARPVTTPRSPDQSQAAIVLSYSDGVPIRDW